MNQSEQRAIAEQSWRNATACKNVGDPQGAIMWLEDARDRYTSLLHKGWVIRCNRGIALQRKLRTRMLITNIFKRV